MADTKDTTTTRRVLPMPRYMPADTGQMVRDAGGQFVRLDDVLLLLAFLRGAVADSVAGLL